MPDSVCSVGLASTWCVHLTSYLLILSENNRICCFSWDNPTFLSVPSV